MLFADLEQALAGYELTEVQMTALYRLLRENLDELARELTVTPGLRWSKAKVRFVWHAPTWITWPFSPLAMPR